ncbi:metallophosphoesterase [Winogradskyella bathintestinalis]|uniref:Metallophosphoesterase n=1 Tax=Winogradskyella bathintestinalis TaxID=3035208 RepID=A0ABT7ZQ01_9FLAO|nr:metallophosphoesterase [Winogradskyella bathintestinalis]MDN3491111.1 metallophosphoesterase [Winogradskyella bathintestinalis]
MLRWIILIILIFILDFYAFQVIKTLTKSYWIYVLYWILSILVVANFAYYYFNFVRGESFTHGHGYAVAFLFTVFVPKVVLVLFMFGEDLVRIGTYLFQKFSNDTAHYNGRREFVSKIALGVAAIPFASFVYGITKGKYNFQVLKRTIYFEDLPETFDGYKITQISDIHSGSLESKEDIAFGVNLVNEQNSDVILFTGDIVNSKAEEMQEWIPVFDKLKAKDGKYSVLGNHDYGYYAYGGDVELNRKNQIEVEAVHKSIGFDLLLNENRRIEKNGEHINILGVENWGASRHFPKRGSLKEATKNIGENDFNILMSHDPSHFDYTEMELNTEDINNHDIIIDESNIINFSKHIHLTLAGHTHGMQFGIELPRLGIKWSPVKYRYPKWAGLYKKASKYLYVNRGFGYLAFPGRIGIWPEITVIELKRGTESA